MIRAVSLANEWSHFNDWWIVEMSAKALSLILRILFLGECAVHKGIAADNEPAIVGGLIGLPSRPT